MEFYIILGFILFIAGVAGTYVYDHVQAQVKRRAELIAARPPRPVPAPRKSQAKSKPGPFTQSAQQYALDNMIADVKARAARGETTLRVQQGPNPSQTMTVEQLIKKLEQMKKEL